MSDNRYIYWDTAQMFQGVLAWMLTASGFGAIAPFSYELGTWNGYRQIFVLDPGELGERVAAHFVTMAIAADEKTNFRDLVRAGPLGFYWPSLQIQPLPSPDNTYALNVQGFNAACEIKRAMIDAWTNGSCGLAGSQAIDAAGGLVRSVTTITPVVCDAEVFSMEDKLFWILWSEEEDLRGPVIAPPYSTGFGGSGSDAGMASALSKIASALTDISKTSRIAWVNNSGGFADIVTGDNVTAGG